MKILVVAAYDPELAVVAQAVRADATLAATVVTAAVGIGLVAAAIGAIEAIRLHAPDRVVLIGTAGAYVRPGHTAPTAIGTLACPAETALVDYAIEASKASGLPAAFAVQTLDETWSRSIRASLGNSAAPRVATSLAITTDSAVSEARGARFDLEHLELSAVASACAKASVPFAAILGVANGCGSSARAEWLAHHAAVESALGEAAVRYLRSLPTGDKT